jgi:hypothetical protein
MLDNDLIQIFLPILTTNLIAQGYSDVVVKQDYQPTQQGADNAKTVYFHKIDDHRYGFPERNSFYDPSNPPGVMTRIAKQFYETRFQFSAWIRQEPTIIGLTSSDLVNIVAAIFQDQSVVNQLDQQNIGVLRITDVRNPMFLDDRDEYQASPSFDLTLIHQQIITLTAPAITNVTAGIYPV